MADPKRVVVDTNILLAALLSRASHLRESIFADRRHAFFSPRFVIVEMFKHKERIASATELNGDELLEYLNALMARIHFVEEGVIPVGTWMEARRLCSEVDPKDAPFVTLALHLNGLLWTNDAVLEAGLRAKGFDDFFAAGDLQ